MTIEQELKKPFSSPYVEMFEIDGRNIHSSLYFHFTPHSDTAFVFGGKTWDPFPISIEGTEVTTDQQPRPKLRISNATKVVQPYLQQHGDLVGVKVTRRRTLELYLQGQPGAATPSEMPLEVYFINTLLNHTAALLEFELVSVFDLPNVKLPRAQALRDQTGGHSMYAPGLSMNRQR